MNRLGFPRSTNSVHEYTKPPLDIFNSTDWINHWSSIEPPPPRDTPPDPPVTPSNQPRALQTPRPELSAIERIVLRLQHLTTLDNSDHEESTTKEEEEEEEEEEGQLEHLLQRKWVRADKIYASPPDENLVPDWSSIQSGGRRRKKKKKKKRKLVLSLGAELAVGRGELTRLAGLGRTLRDVITVPKAGLTHAVMVKVLERWKDEEVVKLKFHQDLAARMMLAKRIVESRTGGWVVRLSGAFMVVFRGTNFEEKCIQNEDSVPNSSSHSYENAHPTPLDVDMRSRASGNSFQNADLATNSSANSYENADSLTNLSTSPTPFDVNMIKWGVNSFENTDLVTNSSSRPTPFGVNNMIKSSADTDSLTNLSTCFTPLDVDMIKPSGNSFENADSGTNSSASLTHLDVNMSKSVAKLEYDRLLDGLGPRFTEWWGVGVLPVDGDLLPSRIPGYMPPFRVLPIGKRCSLTDKELQNLRKLSKTMPPHFALGRNRRHHGLAAAIVKLWERSFIAIIAVKQGVQNTNNKLMAEELRALTGGTLLLRNKYYIIFYRGKDFVPAAVASGLLKRTLEIEEKTTTRRIKVKKMGKISKCPTIKPKRKHVEEEDYGRSAVKAEELLMFKSVGMVMKVHFHIRKMGDVFITCRNMHVGWKNREVVKVMTRKYGYPYVEEMGRRLEQVSGGILVAIEPCPNGYALIYYRGRDYRRPRSNRFHLLMRPRQL